MLMNDPLFSFHWINYQKLNILGIDQVWVNYIAFTLMFLLIYVLIHPIVLLMVRKRDILLSYLVSSLLFMLSCILIALWPNYSLSTYDGTVLIRKINNIKHVFIIVGVVGVVLAGVNYIKYIFYAKT